MEQITVTIPAQQWNDDKYQHPSDCYLGEQLHSLLPDSNIWVSIGFDENGNHKGRLSGGLYTRVSLERELYITKYPFNEDLVKDAFAKGQDIKVTLVKL